MPRIGFWRAKTYKASEITEGRFNKGKLEITLNKLLKGAGAGVDPTEIDVPAGATITSGQYTGDDTENRAIAHGLGVVPKAVLFKKNAFGASYWQIAGVGEIHRFSGGVDYTVTTPTTTNFYVGNAGSYDDSANQNAIVFDWVAIG